MAEIKAKDCSVEHHPEKHTGYARVKIALFVCLGLACVQGVGSWLSGSLALLADTVHVLGDGVALAMSLVAGWMASRPASLRKSYGFYRLEVLAALVNGGALIVIALGIFWEAYQRLQSPSPIVVSTMFVAASLGLLFNLVMLKILHSARDTNMNIRGAYLHVLGDSLSSVVVVLSAVLIYFTQILWIDVLASALVSMMIFWMAVRLLMQSTHVLLEGAPTHLNLKEVETALRTKFPEITDIHDFHVWEITSHLFALTAHLEAVELSPKDQNSILERLQSFARKEYGISHTTFQIEFHAAKRSPSP